MEAFSKRAGHILPVPSAAAAPGLGSSGSPSASAAAATAALPRAPPLQPSLSAAFQSGPAGAAAAARVQASTQVRALVRLQIILSVYIYPISIYASNGIISVRALMRLNKCYHMSMSVQQCLIWLD